MKVNLLDLKIQYNNIKDEIRAAIDEVLESTHFIMGENVKKLEEEIAEFCGVKRAIAVANGTDALLLSLRALGIEEGDEVITSPFTFFASAETSSLIGAKPVFVDINPETLCIDENKIEEAITEKTKAIIPVHIFGQMCNMDKIMDIAKKHNLLVIEDAAQAIGAEFKGIKVGNFGNVGTFSFFPTKNLGAYGDAGMIVTNDEDLADKLCMLRKHGTKKQYMHEMIGHNSRLDEIQAAILRVKLNYLEKWTEDRRKNAERYNELLKDINVKTPVEMEERRHVYHQYCILVENKEEVLAYLKEKGIGFGNYYPIPVHQLPIYKELGYSNQELPVSEEACKKSIALPMYPELNEEQQRYVVDCLREIVK